MAGHIFLSYSSQDRAYVERLAAEITGAGLSVWFDRGLSAGEQWSDVLERKIETCTAMVVVMSESSANSTWVKRELKLAEDLGKPVLPLLLSGRIWFVVNHLHTIDVRDGRMPDASLRSRLAALDAAAGRHASRPTASVQPASVPALQKVAPSSSAGAIGHLGPIRSVSWQPDGPLYVTTGADGACRVWNALGNRVETVIEVPDAGDNLLAVWGNDYGVVITGGVDGLHWWNASTGKEVHRSVGHGRITALHAQTGYRTEQTTVAAGTSSGHSLLLKSHDVQTLPTGPEDEPAQQEQLGADPQPREVVAVAVGESQGLFKTRTSMVAAVDWSRDGETRTRVWGGTDGIAGPPQTIAMAKGMLPSSQVIGWSHDGDLVVANPASESATARPRVEIWPNGRVADKRKVKLPRGLAGSGTHVTAVAWASHMPYISVGMSDGLVHLCDAIRRKVVWTGKAGRSGPVAMHWSDLGQLLATIPSNALDETHVWRSMGRSSLAIIPGPVSALAWAPRGNRLVVGGADGDVWMHHFGS